MEFKQPTLEGSVGCQNHCQFLLTPRVSAARDLENLGVTDARRRPARLDLRDKNYFFPFRRNFPLSLLFLAVSKRLLGNVAV